MKTLYRLISGQNEGTVSWFSFGKLSDERNNNNNPYPNGKRIVAYCYGCISVSGSSVVDGPLFFENLESAIAWLEEGEENG